VGGTVLSMDEELEDLDTLSHDYTPLVTFLCEGYLAMGILENTIQILILFCIMVVCQEYD
jgi:hypothetical protein